MNEECCEEEIPQNRWLNLPYHLLLEIFKHLSLGDLAECSLVSPLWYALLRDNLTWKTLFLRRWDSVLTIEESAEVSWLEEYAELHRISQIKSWLTLRVHSDEVLHVTFSHNGRYFVTSSKDCRVIVWQISPYSRKSITILGILTSESWAAALKAEFNQTDEFLMVTAATDNLDATGDIDIYHIPSCSLVTHAFTSPHDTFGSWFGINSFVTALHNSEDSLTGIYLHEMSNNGRNPRLIFTEDLSRTGYNVRFFSVARERHRFSEVFLFYATHYHFEDLQLNNQTLSHVISSIRFKHTETVPERDGGLATFPLPPPVMEPPEIPQSATQDQVTREHRCVGGAIVGIESDIDSKRVYVNCRKWMDKTRRSIAPDIEIKIFDFNLNLLWSVYGGECLTEWNSFFILLPCISVPYFMSPDEMGDIRFFDHRHQTTVCTKSGHDDVISLVRASPADPNFVVSVSDDYTVKVWDIPAKKEVPQIPVNKYA